MGESRLSRPGHEEATGETYVPARPPADSGPVQAAARFLRSFHVLLRSTRLYHKNHPRTLESLETAGRCLREALALSSPLAFAVERERVQFAHRPLSDRHGELASLAKELTRRGISSVVFLPETHLGELDTLAALVEAEPPNPLGRHGPRWNATAEWVQKLDDHRIRGIRINLPTEGKAEAVLTSLLVAVFSHRLSHHGADSEVHATNGKEWVARTASAATLPSESSVPVELAAAVHLLAGLSSPLATTVMQAPEEAARIFRDILASADPEAVRAVGTAMTRHAPVSGEVLRTYLARLAEALVLEHASHRFGTGRTPATGLRSMFMELARTCFAASGFAGCLAQLEARAGNADWSEEAYAERLAEKFWEGLTARQMDELLRGPDAWCVPLANVKSFLGQVIAAGGPRQARPVLLNFARGLVAMRSSARLATATGLAESGEILERLWPNQLPEELTIGVAAALAAESLPEVAAVQLAAADHIAEHALHAGDYASISAMLTALDEARLAQPPRSERPEHLGSLEAQLLSEPRWQMLVDAALSPRPLDPALPRILTRNPERLLDALGTRLAESRTLDSLPAMARLLRTIGEPGYGGLELLLADPRASRATTAVKLLATTQPERLIAALPRVLPGWDWSLQDMAISEVSRLGIPGTAAVLLEVLPDAHALVVPMILDLIGLEQEIAGIPVLKEIAAGEHPGLRDVFVRIKAIEALGRMRAAEAADLLREILRRRNGLTYAEPAGLRAVAEEALALVENNPSVMRGRTLHESVIRGTLAFNRPRRYARISLLTPLAAQISGLAPSGTTGIAVAAAPARVKTISLGGAFLESSERLSVGDSLQVDIRAGLRRIQGTAVVRNVAPRGGGVEFVHMKHDDREKLRRLVKRLQHR